MKKLLMAAAAAALMLGAASASASAEALKACWVYVGPIGDHLHSDREFVRTDTIAPRAQIAALFLHRLAAGEITL